LTTPLIKTTDGKASEWTVRQALTHALNLLNDPDREITRCVIVLGHVDGGESDTSLVVRTESAYETAGMLAEALGVVTNR